MIKHKLVIIIITIFILIYSWQSKPLLAIEKPKEEVSSNHVEGISIEQERKEAILKRILSPDIYGRQDPFAPITARASRPSAKKELDLEGIVWDETQPLAIINGLIVGEGEMVNEKKVLRIEKDEVILEQGGKEITLEL